MPIAIAVIATKAKSIINPLFLLSFFDNALMISKINYIHHNPVKRGYIDEASHWRYSSARDYEGVNGLLEVERFW